MTIKQFCDEMGDEKLSKIISDCEELEKFDHSGKAALARRRFSYLHEYIKLFLNFDFHTSQGYEDMKVY